MTHIPYPLIQIHNYVAQSLSVQNGFKVQTSKTSNLSKVAIKKKLIDLIVHVPGICIMCSVQVLSIILQHAKLLV